jgi:hypothetical protein
MKRILACLLAGVFSLAAQEPPRPVLPAELQKLLPEGVVVPGTRGQTNVAKVPTAQERKAQEVMRLRFDRSAQNVFQELARRAQGNRGTNEVDQFRSAVVAGDWTAVGAFLKGLLEPDRGKVYTNLLATLSPSPAGAREDMPPEVLAELQARGNAGAAVQGATAILPGDVLALMQLAPVELPEDAITRLGQLLGRALSRSAVEPFLGELERTSGADTKRRAVALKLLLAAGRVQDAARFLPPLEPALAAKDIPALAIHADYLFATGKADQKPELQKQAWDLNAQILNTTNAPAKEQELALQRAFQLMEFMARSTTTNWLQASFRQHPQQGFALLAAVNKTIALGAKNRQPEVRRKNLQLQKEAVAALLAVGVDRQVWQTPLNLLANNWADEADATRLRYRPRPQRSLNPYDQNDYYQEMMYQQQYENSSQSQPIPFDQVLAVAPDNAWLHALDQSLVPRLQVLKAELLIKNEEDSAALALIETIARADARQGQRLANDFLRGWAQAHNPNADLNNSRRFSPYGPMYGNPYGQGTSTPLTRANQERYLKELARAVERLQKLPIGRLNEKALVSAFTAAHSQAEVFRTENIVQVFGSVDAMPVEMLAELLQTMRQRLASQWRMPRIQQEAKTKRTDKDIEAEVSRGYELVISFIEKAQEKAPKNWRLTLVQAAALFDWAEFQYGKKVDLAIYVEKRDRAFDLFARAADYYRGDLGQLDEKEQTPFVYQQWFNANLGASDLAFVTRQQEPSSNNLARIRAAMLALPEFSAEAHLARFAKELSENAASLKPELKPRFLRAGLQVVQEHPAAVEARKLVTYYDDLLEEIQFDVRVDGDTTVGHQQPFGVVVSLRHTADIERESGGFARYLRVQQQNPYYAGMYPPGQQPNFREDFEKQVREKMVETFDVLTITFADDKIQARGVGRPNWRETPLAYVLLKAKDGAVDRIPSLRMDLDFMDKRGPVLLAVSSQVQLIDARPAQVPARPATKVEVTQILDDRELAKGKLVLEVKATANGLVPDLKELLDLYFAGFKVQKTTDQPLAVSRVDGEGEVFAPVTERGSVMELAPVSDTVQAAFQFPKARMAGAQVIYKRYQDADLAEVKAEVALAGIPMQKRKVWPAVLLGLVAAGVAAYFLRRWQRQEEVAVARVAAYQLPPHITPFTVVNLLRRIEGDQQVSIPEPKRAELSATIQKLERSYFDRPKANGPDPDLEKIARDWIALAE